MCLTEFLFLSVYPIIVSKYSKMSLNLRMIFNFHEKFQHKWQTGNIFVFSPGRVYSFFFSFFFSQVYLSDTLDVINFVKISMNLTKNSFDFFKKSQSLFRWNAIQFHNDCVYLVFEFI